MAQNLYRRSSTAGLYQLRKLIVDHHICMHLEDCGLSYQWECVAGMAEP